MTAEVTAAFACRLCEAEIATADAVELAVPRGVHFFLHAAERATDAPVTIHIVTCPYCGHLQSLDEQIVYDTHANSATYISEPLLEAREDQARRTFAYASEPVHRLLDIGCGDGEFLARVARSVDAVVGLEPSTANADAARRRGIANATIVETMLEQDSVLSGAPFDAFFAFHVLEHVPDVKAFLRGIRRNCRDGAVGCIEVPCSEAAYEQQRYGHFMADHLSYFFLATLRTAVETSGFEIIALERAWAGEHLVAYVRTRTSQSHRPVAGWVTATTAKLTAFLEQAALHDRTVALWGASNPILPVLIRLPATLPFVLVDKAPTKHGRFAPGSHTPIHAPELIERERIDYVIITAPRFFAEIQAELRARFSADIITSDIDVGVADRVCCLDWSAAVAGAEPMLRT